jgi:hypothetical protein
MPNGITRMAAADFRPGVSYVVDWLNHPNFELPLNPGMLLNATSRRYEYDLNGTDQSIVVDTSQNNSIGLNWCAEGFFDSNFSEEDPVLLAGNTTQAPILLTFDPPLRAVGACLSVDGTANETYWGMQYIRCSPNGEWMDPIQVRGTISKDRGTAIYLGAQAPAGKFIHGVAFDASYVGQAPAFPHVAINTLDYLPR